VVLHSNPTARNRDTGHLSSADKLLSGYCNDSALSARTSPDQKPLRLQPVQKPMTKTYKDERGRVPLSKKDPRPPERGGQKNLVREALEELEEPQESVGEEHE
jgi:hypothetical protein